MNGRNPTLGVIAVDHIIIQLHGGCRRERLLNEVASTKLSIEDYNSIKNIAHELFEKRINKAPTISELIRTSLTLALNQHTNTENMEVILGE